MSGCPTFNVFPNNHRNALSVYSPRTGYSYEVIGNIYTMRARPNGNIRTLRHLLNRTGNTHPVYYRPAAPQSLNPLIMPAVSHLRSYQSAGTLSKPSNSAMPTLDKTLENLIDAVVQAKGDVIKHVAWRSNGRYQPSELVRRLKNQLTTVLSVELANSHSMPTYKDYQAIVNRLSSQAYHWLLQLPSNRAWERHFLNAHQPVMTPAIAVPISQASSQRAIPWPLAPLMTYAAPHPRRYQHASTPCTSRRSDSALPAFDRILNNRVASAAPAMRINRPSMALFSRDAWQAIEDQMGASQFYRLLEKLKQHHLNHPGDQVEQRLHRLHQRMIQDPQLCQTLLDEAQIGGESCSDLAVNTLNQLEIRCTIEQALQGKSINDKQMLIIMRSLSRQEQLYQFAKRKVEQLEKQYPSTTLHQHLVDPLEVHLHYHLKLKARLQLLGDTREMTFHTLSGISDQDAENVGNRILSLEKLDKQSLIKFIDNNEHWKRYLTERYQTVHDRDPTITHYADRLEELETLLEQQQINDNDYLQRCNQLMRQRQIASDNWYHNKTVEMICKHLE
ncbi:MAG: NEL-type E3 ubiquitin ligase domain-containing protein [Candidatus Symbiodolus clandestinus]